VSAVEPRSLRPRRAAELYDVSLTTVRQAVRRGLVRSRKAGRATLLCAADCERLWGWSEPPPEPGPRAARFVDRLLGEER